MIPNKVVITILAVCILLFIVAGFFMSSTKTIFSSFKGTIVTSMWEPMSEIQASSNPSAIGPSPPTLKASVKPKTILFWTTFYGMEKWRINAGKEVCGPYTCMLSYDKNQYESASALMFHHRTDWLNRLPTDSPRTLFNF